MIITYPIHIPLFISIYIYIYGLSYVIMYDLSIQLIAWVKLLVFLRKTSELGATETLVSVPRSWLQSRISIKPCGSEQKRSSRFACDKKSSQVMPEVGQGQ